MRTWAATIAVYLIGYLIFLSAAIWGFSYWSPAYYLWDKTKDLLLLFSIIHAPKRSTTLIPMLILAAMRLIWELISVLTGWNINNTKAVGILFMATALIIGFILYKELQQWQKQKRLRQF